MQLSVTEVSSLATMVLLAANAVNIMALLFSERAHNRFPFEESSLKAMWLSGHFPGQSKMLVTLPEQVSAAKAELTVKSANKANNIFFISSPINNVGIRFITNARRLKFNTRGF